MVEHKFNTSVYKNFHGFVSREAQDLVFNELQQVDIVGTDSSACGCTLRVTRVLPCACELTKFISIYGYIPLKSIHVHWKYYPFVVQST